MTTLPEMKPCPRCGASLTAALADAIANPNREERCPTEPKTIVRRLGTSGGLLSGNAFTPMGGALGPGAGGPGRGMPPAAGASVSIVAVSLAPVAAVSITTRLAADLELFAAREAMQYRR